MGFHKAGGVHEEFIACKLNGWQLLQIISHALDEVFLRDGNNPIGVDLTGLTRRGMHDYTSEYRLQEEGTSLPHAILWSH